MILALRTAAGALAGFLVAVPDAGVPGALYVEDTLIDEPFRGHGLVRLLGEALESEAIARGFRYLTRDAAIGGGYADAIERAYAGRVLERRDHGSPYGPQRYLRLALAHAPPSPRLPRRPRQRPGSRSSPSSAVRRKAR